MASSPDRISLLPDCILQLILVLLPLQEVVRTSILSRRWGLLWIQIPKLIFDESFFKSVRDKTELMPIICGIISRNCRPLLDFTFSLSDVSSLDISQAGPIWKISTDYYLKPYELLSLGELSILKRLTCVQLTLNNVNLKVKDAGHNVINLVKHAPNLETVIFSASSCPPFLRSRLAVWPTGDLSNVSLNGLRYIWLENITGDKLEFEFIAILFAKSPMLEVVSVLLHHKLTKEERLEVSEEFRRFQYASSSLSIKFYKYPSKIKSCGLCIDLNTLA